MLKMHIQKEGRWAMKNLSRLLERLEIIGFFDQELSNILRSAMAKTGCRSDLDSEAVDRIIAEAGIADLTGFTLNADWLSQAFVPGAIELSTQVAMIEARDSDRGRTDFAKTRKVYFVFLRIYEAMVMAT